ncbi:hypothetical protein J1605_006216 [Eschrichtius robustus]|uniref:Indoleamine 2,3-dioxygenase 2 n=1 Tax=Eschrichtius robustus TaxID=9764 RepID=A0AB34H6V7_ESCRO|nr:hypothetical protein J1605_006216 [Eschrichtius robustus]
MQKELPDHYRPWMEIANRLPHLIGSHQLRAQVNEMPLLNCQFLTGYREQRLAHLVLTFITMGYVWQDGEAQPKENVLIVWIYICKVLPRTLALPLVEVSRDLGLPPILLHSDLVLANWATRNPGRKNPGFVSYVVIRDVHIYYLIYGAKEGVNLNTSSKITVPRSFLSTHSENIGGQRITKGISGLQTDLFFSFSFLLSITEIGLDPWKSDLSLSYLNVVGGNMPILGLPCGEENVNLCFHLGLTVPPDSRPPLGPAYSLCPDLSNHMVISLPRNLDPIFLFPGGESLRGFILVTVLVEKAAVPGIKVSSHSQTFFFLNEKSV